MGFGRQVGTSPCYFKDGGKKGFGGYSDRWDWVVKPTKGQEGLTLGYNVIADKVPKQPNKTTKNSPFPLKMAIHTPKHTLTMQNATI